MNGELAQLVCLASYGTAWLAGDGAGAPPDLEQRNSTFRFVGTLEFVDTAVGRSTTTVRDWLHELRSRGTRRLWLIVAEPRPRPASWGPVDEHMLVGFVNTGAWTLLATAESNATVWRRNWVPAHPDAPDRRVWSVPYEAQAIDAAAPTPPSVEQAGQALTDIVTRARDFSVRAELDRWVTHFNGVLGDDQSDGAFPDMLSPAFPPEAQQLARTASAAWVFGGMGSWNDEWVPEELNAEYEEISKVLYVAVLQALVASVDGPVVALPRPGR